MAQTPSNMIALGTIAPDFALPCPATKKIVSLQDVKSDIGTVVMFICNHCPFVLHIAKEIAQVADAWERKGIHFVAINANDTATYPDDHPDKMPAFAEKYHFNFPYLFDESQQTAKAYQAACTPDFFVFDAQLRCVYRGRFDSATPGNGKPVNGTDLSTALSQMIAGKPVSVEQRPSMGCNIKWKT